MEFRPQNKRVISRHFGGCAGRCRSGFRRDQGRSSGWPEPQLHLRLGLFHLLNSRKQLVISFHRIDSNKHQQRSLKSKRKRTLNVFFAAFSGAFGFRKTSFGGGVGGWRGKWSITFLDNKPKFGLDCLIFGRMFYRDHIIQHTSCSLGSVLGNSALGAVFLDTVNPNPNIP